MKNPMFYSVDDYPESWPPAIRRWFVPARVPTKVEIAQINARPGPRSVTGSRRPARSGGSRIRAIRCRCCTV